MNSAWTQTIDLNMPLNEYPRMLLQRGSYTCLNGEWEYIITRGQTPGNTGWKKIIVPFALGSQLSGTTDNLMPGEVLWYHRTFSYPATQERTLLNFEAVDQSCQVYVNGTFVGEHHGGYTPFSCDITQVLKEENEILVSVTDDTDLGIYAYGKQKLEPGGMWYTPSAGIWQTVWLESLPEHTITDIKITPDCKNHCAYVSMAGDYTQAVISVFAKETMVHRGITADNTYTIPMEHYHPWSPSDPFLYSVYVQLDGETVKSYFAMRSFSVVKDEDGHARFGLNGQPLFLSGLLDQGYSSDGLLTYPCEDAMVYELKKLKDLGFNMIRKHIKVECRRWYYLCDKLGLLVMQDIPSGGSSYDFMKTALLPTLGKRCMDDHDYTLFGRNSEESRRAYYAELDEILNHLYNSPCIFAWVPFNEGWGQFDSKEVTEYIREYDSTRLVDSASGWHDQGAGDFNSRHCYFTTFHVPPADGRICLLSEFGGYTFLEHGHSTPRKLYGYRKFKDKLKLNDAIIRLYQRSVLDNIPKGLAGCIYTQTADVEDECNGLFTADRKVLKVDEKKMRRMNERCIRGVR